MLNFLKRKTDFFPLELQSYSLPNVPDSFIQSEIKVATTNLVEDVLECYFFDKIGMDNVYAFEERGLKEASLTIKDILLASFLGKRQVISRVRLKNDQTSLVIFTNKETEKDGMFELGENGRIKPEKVVIFEEIFQKSKIELLEQCFKNLWYLYKRLERKDTLDQKFIYKMHGFHALFTEPKNQEEQYISAENKRLIKENVQAIIEGNGGIIDSQDDIGLFGSNNAEKGLFLSQIDAVYSEVARILTVPITRLTGRSPQGFNATGESDIYNYEMTLSRYRNGWLEPFLNQMDIAYKKVEKLNIAYMKDIVEMYNYSGLEPSEKFKNKVESMVNYL